MATIFGSSRSKRLNDLESRHRKIKTLIDVLEEKDSELDKLLDMSKIDTHSFDPGLLDNLEFTMGNDLPNIQVKNKQNSHSINAHITSGISDIYADKKIHHSTTSDVFDLHRSIQDTLPQTNVTKPPRTNPAFISLLLWGAGHFYKKRFFLGTFGLLTQGAFFYLSYLLYTQPDAVIGISKIFSMITQGLIPETLLGLTPYILMLVILPFIVFILIVSSPLKQTKERLFSKLAIASIIPGAGQILNGKRFKGTFIYMTFIGVATITIMLRGKEHIQSALKLFSENYVIATPWGDLDPIPLFQSISIDISIQKVVIILLSVHILAVFFTVLGHRKTNLTH